MTDELVHPEEVVVITRQIWRLKIIRMILALVVAALALTTVVLTEVVAIRYGATKSHEVQQAKEQVQVLQATIDKQGAVAACRSKISGEWINALDAVIKTQAQSLVIVYTEPLNREALNQKRAEMDQALAQLDAADDKRAHQDELCK
jgi:hypothetical protein